MAVFVFNFIFSVSLSLFFFLISNSLIRIHNSIEFRYLLPETVNSRFHYDKVTFFSCNVINHNMRYMEKKNNVTEFILLGLTQNPKLQKVVFAVFLVVYVASMVGNVLTFVTITTSSLLGSPMYFLLAHLSFIDACYSFTLCH